MRNKRNATRYLVATAAIVSFLILFNAFYIGVDISTIIMLGFFLTVLLVMMAFAGSIVDATAIMRRAPEPRDPSEIQRVIAESLGGLEIIVSGPLKMTYREACLNYWDFKRIQKNDNWIIVDERGNDITNVTLDSYNGLAKIMLLGGIERSKSTVSGEIERYTERTERDYGVTFYD